MSITLTKEQQEQKTTLDYGELITVVVKYPGKPSEIQNIVKELSTYENIVGGYVAAVPFPGLEDTVDLLMDDCGKMKWKDIKPNILAPEYRNYFVGPLIAIGVTENLTWRSLTPDEISAAKEYLDKNSVGGSNIQKEE